MTYQSLKFAIDDAQRFIDRAKWVLENTTEDNLVESDVKILNRLSLDVTRALTDLRKEAKPTR